MKSKSLAVFVAIQVFCFSACAEMTGGQSLLIYKNADRIQCDDNVGLSSEETSQQLSEAKIEVRSTYCGIKRGMMVSAVCGQSTLDINVHKISDQDWRRAKALGFNKVADLTSGYQQTDCKNK
jgi:hypothetical protein